MHADDLILVTGATGNTGSNLLQELGRRVPSFMRWCARPRTGPAAEHIGLCCCAHLRRSRCLEAAGHFVAPIGDARVSAVDVRDIAAVTGVALTEQGHDGKTDHDYGTCGRDALETWTSLLRTMQARSRQPEQNPNRFCIRPRSAFRNELPSAAGHNRLGALLIQLRTGALGPKRYDSGDRCTTISGRDGRWLCCTCFVPDTQVSSGFGGFWRFGSGLNR